MTQFTDLRTDAERIRQLRLTINSLNINHSVIRKMSHTELDDVSDVLLHLESLLLKYQSQREMLHLLESLGDIMHEAADGIVSVNTELNDIMVNNEISCKRIQEVQLSICGESIKNILDEKSSKNFTKSEKKVDNVNYNLQDITEW
ncbi:MAG: hypothetical protein F4Y18_05195 [Cenarchaeum sp. SB0663_bin_5]|nr:hypothetical protein [Cenarchaeum sp. SB0663_bin_5]MYH04493.1 hypothetical protein [Cenarchaeum sp. SB0675_bin_21]